MRVLITGANGFLGKNLQLFLSERKDIEVVCFNHEHDLNDLVNSIQQVDFVFHFAGVNRTQDSSEFQSGNTHLTELLCRFISESGRSVPIIYTSSIQATNDSLYGISKRDAENTLFKLHQDFANPVYVFRLPNVFGKWSKPNYNSVVATFCFNISHNLPIQVNDPSANLRLVYVDDVIHHFIRIMDQVNGEPKLNGFETVQPEYNITVQELATQIKAFKNSRLNLTVGPVGVGFLKALYSTYLSYLPTDDFAYSLPRYEDNRGVFVEMLKTSDSGQFSYFTTLPGVTRGGHYHHTKTEKFLVIKGLALFRFRHMYTGEQYELTISGTKAQIVETVPGWTHDITNIGSEEMIVMLWANEVFDREKPDTFSSPL